MASTMQSNNKNVGMSNKNRFKPYERKERSYNDIENTTSNGECNKNRLSKFDENKDQQQQTFQSIYAQATKRLLSRRYPLTKDGRKYLEIGINISSEKKSFIEIALGEVFKKEITLTFKDWSQLMHMKSGILEFFQSNTESVSIHVNDVLNIVADKYKNIKLLYFIESNENCIVLAETSFLKLLKLKHCVNSQCSGLNQILESIDEKIEIFSNVDNIKNQEDFDKTSIIDNEIVALYFDK